MSNKKEIIAEKIRERYFPIIPEPEKGTPDQKEKKRLSQCLAAFAIEKLADVSPAQAANAVIDGGDDNGVDAIEYDELKKTLWVVQSKIGSAPDQAENKKLCSAADDLVRGRLDKFNERFDRKRTEIEAALATTGVKVIACQIHRGENALGQHAVADLNDKRTELNEISERFDWKELGLDDVFRLLTEEKALRSVNTKLEINNWYQLPQPHKAFYGTVNVNELIRLYNEFGRALFEKNIRYYKGNEDVNEAIKNTVKDAPGELFYLNNGITAVCRAVRLPARFTQKEVKLSIEGLSIVNGAQTAGSIAQAAAESGGVPLGDAKVLFTIIEVGEDPVLGKKITRARNTQNKISILDFVALDPQQERLRREMALLNIRYEYRPSEEEQDNDIRAEEAAVAIACLRTDLPTIVTAKKQVGLLYDTDHTIYPVLFNSNLSGAQVVRLVRIYEYLNGILASSEAGEVSGSRRKLFYRHSRYFLMNLLNRFNRAILQKEEVDLSETDKLELSRIITDYAEDAYTSGESIFGGSKGYLSIFRNQQDSSDLFNAFVRSLITRRNAAMQIPAAPSATSEEI